MTVGQLFGIAAGVLIISAFARAVSAFVMWFLIREEVQHSTQPHAKARRRRYGAERTFATTS